MAVPPKARKVAKHAALRKLGVRIRALRLERQLSQEALADRASIGRSYMSGIERGVRNCSVLHVIRVAKALGVSTGELFAD